MISNNAMEHYVKYSTPFRVNNKKFCVYGYYTTYEDGTVHWFKFVIDRVIYSYAITDYFLSKLSDKVLYSLNTNHSDYTYYKTLFNEIIEQMIG